MPSGLSAPAGALPSGAVQALPHHVVGTCKGCVVRVATRRGGAGALAPDLHIPRGMSNPVQQRSAIARREAQYDEAPKSLTDAFENVVEAGQDLILQRIDLQAERLFERATGMLRASLGIAAGGIVALVGWFLFVSGVVDALAAHLSHATAAMLLGLAHVALGVALALGLRRGRLPAPRGDGE